MIIYTSVAEKYLFENVKFILIIVMNTIANIEGEYILRMFIYYSFV